MENPPKKIKRRGANGWVVVILLLVFTGLGWLFSAATTYVMPKRYQSRAVVELIPQDDTLKSWGIDAFMDTEIEVIRGHETLLLVVDKLQLETHWGIYTEDAAKIVAQQMKVRQLKDGRVVEITFRHRKKEEAQAVTSAIYEAYKDRRYQLYVGGLKNRLKAIQIMRQNKDDRVAELRKRLMDITEKVGGGYIQKDGEGLDIDRLRSQQELDVAKDEYLIEQSQLHAMEKEYSELRQKMEMPVNFIVVHEVPSISHGPVSPNIQRNLSRGLIAGFLLGLFVVALYLLVKRCA